MTGTATRYTLQKGLPKRTLGSFGRCNYVVRARAFGKYLALAQFACLSGAQLASCKVCWLRGATDGRCRVEGGRERREAMPLGRERVKRAGGGCFVSVGAKAATAKKGVCGGDANGVKAARQAVEGAKATRAQSRCCEPSKTAAVVNCGELSCCESSAFVVVPSVVPSVDFPDQNILCPMSQSSLPTPRPPQRERRSDGRVRAGRGGW